MSKARSASTRHGLGEMAAYHHDLGSDNMHPRGELGLVRGALFFFLVFATVLVLTYEISDIVEQNGGFGVPEVSTTAVTVPVLPAVEDEDTARKGSTGRREFLTTSPRDPRRTMRFTMLPDGVLRASGGIDEGAAVRFEAELARHGEHVSAVSLDSPGGSLNDAMAMAKQIREKGLATEVRDGATCASSCPLVLAGGRVRKVAREAAVGVHQFYAVSNREVGPEQAMADAQLTTARITRHLIAMGVDPALWLHALDTPPRQLYYFSPEELSGYRLVTDERTAALTD